VNLKQTNSHSVGKIMTSVEYPDDNDFGCVKIVVKFYNEFR